MNFKIADFKVINRVANTLSIDVNTNVFDHKVSGNITLLNIPEVVEGAFSSFPISSIYTESITVDVVDTTNMEEEIKVAAAKQLSVTYL